MEPTVNPELKSVYAATCVCGKTNFVKHELEPFTCDKCEIVGVIDFTRFTGGELIQSSIHVMNKAGHLTRRVKIRLRIRFQARPSIGLVYDGREVKTCGVLCLDYYVS